MTAEIQIWAGLEDWLYCMLRTCKCQVPCTTVKATTVRLEAYAVSLATTQNPILGPEKQVLQWHGTPERTESENEANFQSNLIDMWLKDHGIG